MDVNHVTPFIVGFNTVIPPLGFKRIDKGQLQVKKRNFTGSGIIIIVGMVGQLKGNVVYVIGAEAAKKIASVMMNGKPVEALDDMAKSALGELANMLAAHAATAFSAMKMLIKISTPACFEGNDITVTMSASKVFGVQMLVDDMPIDVNISLEN